MPTSRLGCPGRWDAVVRGYPVKHYAPGCRIRHQGDADPHVHIVCAGITKLVHCWIDGRSSIIGLRCAPTLLGMESALSLIPPAVAVDAATPCIVCRIPAREFHSRVDGDLELSHEVYAELSREVGRHCDQLAMLSTLSARERLRVCIQSLAQELAAASPGGEPVALPIRDWELAQLLSITPQYMSRLLHECEHEGFLRRERGRWILANDFSTVSV